MKKQEVRKDIFGVEPEIGDLIAFNPPRYSGLISGICMGFAESGLPEVDTNQLKHWFKKKWILHS